MKPRELIASAPVPGSKAMLHCWRHDGAYSLWLDRTELMSSRVHGSEQALAERACAAAGGTPWRRVLVGGLGMGFTLARALQLAAPDAELQVCELVPEVLDWNRELFGQCAGQPLADPRVQASVGDVVAAIAAAAPASLDAILLDVDNGPEALVRPGNDQLYGVAGLRAARAALRPGGALAIWSSAPSPQFASRVKGLAFAVTEHRVTARAEKGPRRTIWTAVRR